MSDNEDTVFLEEKVQLGSSDHGSSSEEENELVSIVREEQQRKLSEASLITEVVKEPEETPNWVFYASYFVMIATILGTGILGLPVTLSESGFTPFVITYTIGFVMQSFAIAYTVEILQRAKSIALHDASGELQSHDALQDTDMIPLENISVLEEKTWSANDGTHISLHTLAQTFLGRNLRICFDCFVVLHFVSVLIAYALTGPQAYASLLNLDFKVLILPFIFVWTLVILFGANVLQALISILTFCKGSLLVALVIVTALVAHSVNGTYSEDWVFVGKPFLLGTVALGGGPTLIPTVFGKVAGNRKDVKKFLLALILGLFTVFALNVAWCYYMLRVVPQTSSDYISMYGQAPDEIMTLADAAADGKISTVPLYNFILAHYPSFTWAAVVVSLFIMLSVTVSYLTMGMGLKHMLDGLVPFIHIHAWIMYAVCFGVITLVALFNPNSFLHVLEAGTSLAMNFAAGFALVWMFHVGRTQRGHFSIPLALPDWVAQCHYLVRTYFLFAISYDTVRVVASIFV